MAEDQFKLPDHRLLGEIAVGLWGMPSFVADVARRHHDIPGEKVKYLDLYTIIALANQLTHAGLKEDRFMEPDLVARLRAIAQIDENAWNSLVERAQTLAIQAKSIQFGNR